MSEALTIMFKFPFVLNEPRKSVLQWEIRRGLL